MKPKSCLVEIYRNGESRTQTIQDVYRIADRAPRRPKESAVKIGAPLPAQTQTPQPSIINSNKRTNSRRVRFRLFGTSYLQSDPRTFYCAISKITPTSTPEYSGKELIGPIGRDSIRCFSPRPSSGSCTDPIS